MRAGGVPARVVTGYQGGELNSVGNYMIVRQADAHAWVEVWLNGEGWMRVDPTAAVSPARVQSGAVAAVPQGEALPLLLRSNFRWLQSRAIDLGHARQFMEPVRARLHAGQSARPHAEDRHRRCNMAEHVDASCSPCTAAVTLVLASLMLYRLRALRPDPAVAAYARFCAQLARRGVTPASERRTDRVQPACRRCAPELAIGIAAISAFIREAALRPAGAARTTSPNCSARSRRFAPHA